MIWVLPGTHELSHGGLILGRNALPAKYRPQGYEKDFDIQRNAAVVHVPDVMGKTVVPIQLVAPIHLRPSGYAGYRFQATLLLR